MPGNWTDDRGIHRLPGPADDAVIGLAGIAVTHKKPETVREAPWLVPPIQLLRDSLMKPLPGGGVHRP